MTSLYFYACVARVFFYGAKWPTQTPIPTPFSLPHVMPTKCQLLPYETPVFIGYIVFKDTPSANPPCACTSDKTWCPIILFLFLLVSVPQTWTWHCNYNVVL